MNSGEWDGFFQELSKFVSPKREKNIFSLGGRAYYENPVSDILKFFLNPNEEHGLGVLVLSSLVECVLNSNDLPIPLTLEGVPEREYVTKERNRIDLLLNGNGWVTVLENKIRHDFCNPFDDYVDDVKAEYPNKQHYFVILAPPQNPGPDMPDEPWRYVGYKQFLEKIRGKLGAQFVASGISKWTVLLREFLMNIEDQITESMENSDFTFVGEHYSKFVDAVELHRRYLARLREEIGKVATESFGSPVAPRGPTPWLDEEKKDMQALQVYPWSGRLEHVTFLVLSDGQFRIQFNVAEKLECFKDEGAFWFEGKPDGDNTFCLRTKDENNLDAALEVFRRACKVIKRA